MAAADYPATMTMIEQGRCRPSAWSKRIVGLAEAAEILPTFDRLPVGGMTMVDPGS